MSCFNTLGILESAWSALKVLGTIGGSAYAVLEMWDGLWSKFYDYKILDVLRRRRATTGGQTNFGSPPAVQYLNTELTEIVKQSNSRSWMVRQALKRLKRKDRVEEVRPDVWAFLK